MRRFMGFVIKFFCGTISFTKYSYLYTKRPTNSIAFRVV
jgi:hypothetical protein